MQLLDGNSAEIVFKVHLTSNFFFDEIGKIVILEDFWRKNFSNLINSLPVSYGETLFVSGSRPRHGSLGRVRSVT